MGDFFERLEEARLYKKGEINKIRDAYSDELDSAKSQRDLEIRWYEEFVAANKNEAFLDLSHIDKLGLEYDVLIVTSIKNTGKNVGIIYNRFKHYHSKGQKVMFLRTSQKEIVESVGEYNNTPANPFFFKKTKGVYTAYWKETKDTEPEECGIFKDFKFCNSGSGGEFDEYGAIIYDECISWDPRNTLNTSHYLNWAALVSSVTRNKKRGIKVFCLGNLGSHNTGLLDYYGIHRDDRLRYIRREAADDPKNVCSILYINVNNIYKGITQQIGAVQGMAHEFKAILSMNVASIHSLDVIEPSDYNAMEIHSGFIFKAGDNTFLYQIVKTPFDRFNPAKEMYALRVTRWKVYLNNTGNKIVSDLPYVANSCDCITLVDSIQDDIDFLMTLVDRNKLLLYDGESRKWLDYLYTKHSDNRKFWI